MSQTIDTTTGAMRDTLKAMFFTGPVCDGNVPSKAARDGLCRAGYAIHAHGFAFLTSDGVELCIRMGMDRDKERWQEEARRTLAKH